MPWNLDRADPRVPDQRHRCTWGSLDACLPGPDAMHGKSPAASKIGPAVSYRDGAPLVSTTPWFSRTNKKIIKRANPSSAPLMGHCKALSWYFERPKRRRHRPVCAWIAGSAASAACPFPVGVFAALGRPRAVPVAPTTCQARRGGHHHPAHRLYATP